ncbi:hypothetical protein GCK72_000024 [Caenorhabditis remanei]|uniref:Uncharacterized protein n=1 Tax=Caenorhabditis remanei TaxID=31234 RepID=A0A6A5HQY8_CAERE|nr:hypothetical protein GCK72_000024 [Caenorhabditis remanei]KAF1768212.1 hypothetical protein GCK72_000024 [Caenorhabditis remanei]
MNHYVAACLLILISLGSILPGFPILMILQNYFPELPVFYTIDSLVMYFVQASIIMFLGFLSMCLYSDIACPLAIKGYVFIFSRIYILLEDLESWFSNGFVTPEDSIRIFEKSGVSVNYTISSLIKLYGSRHPFRRIPDLTSSDSEDVPGPSEKSGKMGGAFGLKKVESNGKDEKSQFVYLDFPLFNVDNEKEDERITGKAVIDEMEKLKKLFPIKRWTQQYSQYFFFLDRRKHGDKEKLTICRLCNYTPFSARLFFLHFFNDSHIRQLSEHQLSRESFDFWIRHFKECGKCEIQKIDVLSVPSATVSPITAAPSLPRKEEKPVVQKISEVKKVPETPKAVVKPETNNPRVPLLDRLATAVRCDQKVFVKSFRQIAESLTHSGREAAKNKSVDWKCEYCGLIKLTTELEAFNHIISQKHKEKMKFTAPTNDFKFWFDWVGKRNAENASQPSPVVQQPPEVKKVPEISKTPVPTISKVPANSPRVPMLDWMPANETAVSKEQFNKILDQCAEVFKKDRKRIEAGKMLVLHSDCSICSSCTRKVRPSNMQDALLHIIKDEHRKNMKYQSCLSDLLYWKSWVETFEVLPKPVKQNPPLSPPPPAPRVDRMTFQYSRKPITKEEKREPFRRPANSPRIPLLDVPQNQASMMPQREFETRYHTIRMELENRTSCLETDKSILCFCFHCHGVRQMTSVYEVMQHIFDGIHDKRIRFNANRSDFDYYDNLIKNMPLRSTNPLPTTKDPEVPFKKSPAVSVVKPVPKVEATPSERPQVKTLNKSRYGSEKNEPFKRPSNDPRIPLLDVPQNQSILVSQTKFKERHKAIILQMKSRNNCPELNQKVTCVCHHCPGAVQLTTMIEVLRHVFSNGDHAKNIRFSAIQSDFDYYDNLLKKCPLISTITPAKISEQVPAAVKRSPAVSVVNPVRKLDTFSSNQFVPDALPTTTRTDCSLPLFRTIDKNLDESICHGPTSTQIDLLRRWKFKDNATDLCYVPNNLYCGFCNANMIGWTILEVANHAFSVSHIYAMLKSCNCLHSSEFDWWITHLSKMSYLTHPSPSELPMKCHLGGLQTSYKGDRYTGEFHYFTPGELQIIDNVDKLKIQLDSQYILKMFGGCTYCEQWFLTGMESVQHFTSWEHFSKIREKHPVNKHPVNMLLRRLELLQKDQEAIKTR